MYTEDQNEYSTAGVVIKDKLFNQTRTVQL